MSTDPLLASLEQAIQEHPTVYESDRARKSLLILAAARIRATLPTDTSLLRAYAECEEAYITTASVDAAIPLWSRHGYTGERKWKPVRAWLEDLRRRALAGETK